MCFEYVGLVIPLNAKKAAVLQKTISADYFHYFLGIMDTRHTEYKNSEFESCLTVVCTVYSVGETDQVVENRGILATE